MAFQDTFEDVLLPTCPEWFQFEPKDERHQLTTISASLKLVLPTPHGPQERLAILGRLAMTPYKLAFPNDQ